MLVPILIFTAVFIACAAAVARALIRMGRQLARTGSEFERLGGCLEDRILPRAEVVTEQMTTFLRDMGTVSERAQAVGDDFGEALASLGDITVMAGEAVQPFVAIAASVGMDGRRMRAIRAGILATFGRLSGRTAGPSAGLPPAGHSQSPVP